MKTARATAWVYLTTYFLAVAVLIYVVGGWERVTAEGIVNSIDIKARMFGGMVTAGYLVHQVVNALEPQSRGE